jgi:tetratricopeptide (TPR) repeat protein
MLRPAIPFLGFILLAAFPAHAADDASAHYDRCMAQAGKNAAAALADATAWGKAGGGAPAAHCAASALLGLKRYGEAAARLDALARAASTPSGMRGEIFAQAGNAWLLAGNGAKAVASLRSALTLTAGDADLFADLGRADAMLRNWKDAVLDLNAAINLRRDSGLFVLRASAYRALKNYRAALADLNSALAIRPSSADAVMERGLLRRDLGDVGGARTDFATVTKTGSPALKRDAAAALDALKD